MTREFISLKNAFHLRHEEFKELQSSMFTSQDHGLSLASFSNINELFATYYLYVEDNVSLAKNAYYNASMATAFGYEKGAGGDPFGICRKMLFPVLSDSNEVIERYLHYDQSPTKKPGTFTYHFGKAVQAALTQDNVKLQGSISWLTKRSKSGLFRQFTGAIKVLEGIIQKDTTVIHEGLVDILRRWQRQQPNIIKEYMNIEASGLAKLAWRCGFEVEVASTYIPKNILPTRELSKYDLSELFEQKLK